MESANAFLVSGTILLAIAALLGLVQYRHRECADAFARWRTVHVGGTAGAVQLLALSGVWDRFGARGTWTTFLVAGIIFATWAFFLGPLAAALDRSRIALAINRIGAAIAVPVYLALPIALLP
jgi:hypothetical protein